MRTPDAGRMSQARARRWLDRLWEGSDLTLVPYERPAPPPEAPKAPVPAPEDSAGDSRELKMKARLDALLSIAPPRVLESSAGSSSSGSSGSSGSSSSSSSAPKKRPLKIDVQGARHAQGVAVVDHLYKLGRAPNPKQRKKGERVRTCELLLEVGKDDINHKELLALQKAQAFSVDQTRPLLIAEAVGQWQKAR